MDVVMIGCAMYITALVEAVGALHYSTAGWSIEGVGIGICIAGGVSHTVSAPLTRFIIEHTGRGGYATSQMVLGALSVCSVVEIGRLHRSLATPPAAQVEEEEDLA